MSSQTESCPSAALHVWLAGLRSACVRRRVSHCVTEGDGTATAQSVRNASLEYKCAVVKNDGYNPGRFAQSALLRRDRISDADRIESAGRCKDCGGSAGSAPLAHLAPDSGPRYRHLVVRCLVGIAAVGGSTLGM